MLTATPVVDGSRGEPTVEDAVLRWQRLLGAWALPAELREAAPEDPYRLPAGLLAEQPRSLGDPTGRPVEAHLPDGGTLLDVGCGPGARAALHAPRARVIGVEPRAELAAAARQAGLEVIEEPWPDAGARAPVADVVLCTHVLYDVADLVPFVAALTTHAREAVVVELGAVHPWARLAPLFARFHDLALPEGPTSDDAVEAIVDGLGVAVAQERWQHPGNRYPDLATLVAHRRRQLCLPASRDDEVAEALEGSYEVAADGTVTLEPREVVTLRWPGAA